MIMSNKIYIRSEADTENGQRLDNGEERETPSVLPEQEGQTNGATPDDGKNADVALTWYERLQKKPFYQIGQRSVLVNTLRVSLVLLLVVAFFFFLVAPHESVVSLNSSSDRIDQIEAECIKSLWFETDYISLSDFDAIVIDTITTSFIYNGVEYDGFHTLVIRPASSTAICEIRRNPDTPLSNITGMYSHALSLRHPLDRFGITQTTSAENKVIVTARSGHEIYYDDIGSRNDPYLTIEDEGSSCYLLLYAGPCSINGSFYVDIYKNNELIVEDQEEVDKLRSLEMKNLGGATISTLGGYVCLQKVNSCNMKLSNIRKAAFAGTGALSYYYTSEGKTDNFENYDIEMESKKGFTGSLNLDEKNTNSEKDFMLKISGEAEDVKYFGRSLFPSGFEWLRENAWTLPVSLITIIGAAVSLTKKKDS